ncbi:MAG: COX15/CtaA family protein [Candidatus Sericytochromatia bacterium]|nr:COX15/CtaA family protein [Candidatus Tanganyikabacteria bacterium]
MDHSVLFRRFGMLLHATAGLTLVLVLVGAIVRSTGSGLGCGTAGGMHDWPLCHGQLIPPATVEAIIEFSHRALAGAVSLCLLGAAGWAAATPPLRARFGGPMAAALALLVLQIGLGALTVRLLSDGEINPAFVVAHLATAFTFFGTLVVIGSHAMKIARGPDTTEPDLPVFPRALVIFTTGAVFFQAITGGLVANLGASMACPEFPACAGGVWVPTLDGAVGLQVWHRIGAVVVSALIVALFFILRPHASAPRRLLAVTVGVLVLQFALGVTTVLLGLPLLARGAHHVVAYALFGSMVAISYHVFSGRPRSEAAGLEGAPAASR